MANRTFHGTQSIVRELKVLPGTISILGNTTPANGTFSVQRGQAFIQSVVRTGVGTYEVTLKDKFPEIQAISLSFEPVSAAARDAVLVEGALTGAQADGKFFFRTRNASFVAADTANNTTDRVHIVIWAKNSSAR